MTVTTSIVHAISVPKNVMKGRVTSVRIPLVENYKEVRIKMANGLLPIVTNMMSK
jgi:hypothetical protein